MFYSSSLYKSGASSFLIDSVNVRVECRGSPGGNSLLMKPAKQVFFVRQRRAKRAGFTYFAQQSYVNTKSNQKKGDPQSGSLRYATGTFRCSEKAGSRANSLRSNKHAP